MYESRQGWIKKRIIFPMQETVTELIRRQMEAEGKIPKFDPVEAGVELVPSSGPKLKVIAYVRRCAKASNTRVEIPPRKKEGD